ncbi:hypothetical protein PybrP1_011203 [[Pythium] brassicae (nom. inval.)]|nr:hypothetical protein PybrP1_011203 [[Pythium] brassicae (nom. inval.)]
MRLALRRPPDVDLRVLEWLFAHVPAERRALQPSDVVVYARSGNLAVVRWLVERCGCAVTRAAVDAAVHGRRPHVLEYLYERSSARCSRTAVDDAARNGYTDIVRVIVSGRRRRAASSADNDNEDDDDAYRSALSGAARNGHLETVKLLAESDIATHDAPRAIDYSAENGHLGVVAYLHERFGQARSNLSSVVNVSDARARGDANAGALRHPRGATANAICTTAALDGAARNGYLEVVKFLHTHRREGCTAAAMDSAAENGHLDIVRFLHEHRREGCTLSALERAVAKCHWDVISFLCDHRLECDVALSLANAVSSSSIGIVKHLHKHLRPEDSAYNALKVAVQESKVEIVKWFCRNQDREPTRFLTRAIADGAPWIAQANTFDSTEGVAHSNALARSRQVQHHVIAHAATHRRLVRSYEGDTSRSQSYCCRCHVSGGKRRARACERVNELDMVRCGPDGMFNRRLQYCPVLPPSPTTSSVSDWELTGKESLRCDRHLNLALDVGSCCWWPQSR